MRGLVVPSLLVVLWEVGGLVHVLPDSASRPSEVVRALVQAVADGSLLRDTWLTLQAALLGFAIAGVLGILLLKQRRKIAMGLRLALAISLLGAVTVEIVLDWRGLGHGMSAAWQELRLDLMFAQIVWLGFVGWALDRGLLFAARKV